MPVTLELTSEEAEAILFALKLRASSAGIRPRYAAEVEAIRARLNSAFETQLGWDHCPDRYKATGDIRVTVTSRNRW